MSANIQSLRATSAALMALRRMTGDEAARALRDIGAMNMKLLPTLTRETVSLVLNDNVRVRPRAMERLIGDYLASGQASPSMTRSMLARFVMTIWGANVDKCNDEAAADVEAHLADIAGYSDQAPYHLIVGGALMLRDDRASAYDAFIRAAEIDRSQGGLTRQHTGAHSVRPWNSDPEWLRSGRDDIAPVSRTIEWRTPLRTPQTPMSLLLTGDVRYFERMALDILADVRALGSRSLVHFHVVGWNAACEAMVSRCEAAYPVVSITSEYYPHQKDFTYFASARFMRAQALLEQIGGAIYIMDLDDRVHKAPEDVYPQIEGDDFGVRFNGGERWLPWTGPGAQAVFIAGTPGGRRFAETMRRYMERAFVPNGDRTWYFDQLLLNEVTYLLMQTEPDLKVGDLMATGLSGARKAVSMRDLKSVRQAPKRSSAG